uniref:EAL domain-containing protein n=1 Tax=Sinorhizobium chiapasense TaxID=501572 RepID=UPI002FE3AAED
MQLTIVPGHWFPPGPRVIGRRLSPGEFIPVAESTGQIVEIGRLMLEAACRDARSFPRDMRVSVNTSVVQLMRDDVVSTVSGLLAATGLPPHRLRLEVTESVVIADVERALTTLSRLKALGVSIALDDFGTGYSALAYLRSFAWDELKIDRSFVQGIADDPQSMAIVRAVVALAGELGVSVVAEGIETPLQHRLLWEAGCQIGQGYLYSKPVPGRNWKRPSARCGASFQTPDRHNGLVSSRSSDRFSRCKVQDMLSANILPRILKGWSDATTIHAPLSAQAPWRSGSHEPDRRVTGTADGFALLSDRYRAPNHLRSGASGPALRHR